MTTPVENLRGAALMTASMAAFTANDALMKVVSEEMPLFQALFLRGLATSLMMVCLARALGAWRPVVSKPDRWRVAARTIAEIAAAYFFLTALFNMPLANATAILQVLPLVVTLAGAALFKERIGWRRMAAILMGFAGVLLIVQPGTDGFTIYSIYALIAVVCVAVRDIVTRGMSGEMPSLMVALAAALGVTLASGAASVTGPWVTPSLAGWACLAGAAVTVIGGYTFSVAAMRVGEIAVVTPFRYTGLVWALILGYLVFGDWPDPITMVGVLIVAATGLYTIERERRLARKTLRS